jgi:hypothetical protein
VAFLFCVFGGEKQAPCGACAGDSKGWACSPSPLRIVHLPPLRGGAPKAQRAAPKIPPSIISNSTSQFVAGRLLLFNSPTVKACFYLYQISCERVKMAELTLSSDAAVADDRADTRVGYRGALLGRRLRFDTIAWSIPGKSAAVDDTCGDVNISVSLSRYNMSNQLSISSHYSYMSDNLQDLWGQFRALRTETEKFQFKPLADFLHIRDRHLSRLLELRPESALQALEAEAMTQAELAHKYQFQEHFGRRPMKLLVSVLFMSQSLCEATINVILAVGFHEQGRTELFDSWERKDFRDKWCDGLDELFPRETFDKSGSIYGALYNLAVQRNAFTHYKSKIEVQNWLIREGVPPQSYKSSKELLDWMHRLISLPYDLLEIASLRARDPSLAHLADRGVITCPLLHKTELKNLRLALFSAR